MLLLLTLGQFSKFFVIRVHGIYFFFMNFLLYQFFALVENDSVCIGFILEVFHFRTFFFCPFVEILLFFRYQVIKSCCPLRILIFVPLPILDLAVDSGTEVNRTWHCHAIIVFFRLSRHWIWIYSSQCSTLRLCSGLRCHRYIIW